MVAQLSEKKGEGLPGIEAVVQRRLGGQVRNFRLLVLADGLVLLGEATTFYAKQLAQHAVMRESAGAILANRIEVT